jgi:hypothetical protein
MLMPIEKNKIIIKRELLKKLNLSNKINLNDIKKKTEEIKTLIIKDKFNRNDINNFNKLKINNTYRPLQSFYNNTNNKRKNKIYYNNISNTTSTLNNNNNHLTSSLNYNVDNFLNSKIDIFNHNNKNKYKNGKKKLNLNFLKEDNIQISNKTFNDNLFPFLKLKKKKKIFLLSNNISKNNLSNSNNSTNNNDKYFENKMFKRKNILSGDFGDFFEKNNKRNKIKIPFQNTLLKYKLEVYFNNIKIRNKFNSNENILL